MDYSSLPVTDADYVADFAKNLAGPMAQMRLFPETVPQIIRDSVHQQGNFLDGYLWLLQYAPKTEFHWHTDLEGWRRTRKRYSGFAFKAYYSTERVVSMWLDQPKTRTFINHLATILCNRLQMDRSSLLQLDTGGVSMPDLPSLLAP